MPQFITLTLREAGLHHRKDDLITIRCDDIMHVISRDGADGKTFSLVAVRHNEQFVVYESFKAIMTYLIDGKNTLPIVQPDYSEVHQWTTDFPALPGYYWMMGRAAIKGDADEQERLRIVCRTELGSIVLCPFGDEFRVVYGTYPRFLRIAEPTR